MGREACSTKQLARAVWGGFGSRGEETVREAKSGARLDRGEDILVLADARGIRNQAEDLSGPARSISVGRRWRRRWP
eukprot:scaffold23240_cov27-Tisochrysis_lutea.AAC.2